MTVIDASALIELLLRTSIGRRAEADLLAQSTPLHAPQLLDLEVLQVLRRYVISRELTVSRADEAVADLADLSVVRHGHAVLRGRIWELRDNLSAYDAAYVALAEALDAPLLTCDKRLAATRGHGADIRLLNSN